MDPVVEAVMKWTERPVCFLCKTSVGPFHRHHKVFRSHGGGDEEENLVLLCEICHMAVHGQVFIRNDGHCCERCPVLKEYGCYFGERLLGFPVETLKPW
jgi:hypothetical protein